MSVDASEVRALAADLAAAPAKVQPGARRVAADGAAGTVADARVLVDIYSGELYASISADLDSDGLGFTAGPTAAHGGYHEFGTSDTAAEPYMLPAFDGQVEHVADDLGDVGVQALR